MWWLLAFALAGPSPHGFLSEYKSVYDAHAAVYESYVGSAFIVDTPATKVFHAAQLSPLEAITCPLNYNAVPSYPPEARLFMRSTLPARPKTMSSRAPPPRHLQL